MSRCPANPPPTAACLTPHQVGCRCRDVQVSSQSPPIATCLTLHHVGSGCPDVQMFSQFPPHSRLSDPSSSGVQMSRCSDVQISRCLDVQPTPPPYSRLSDPSSGGACLCQSTPTEHVVIIRIIVTITTEHRSVAFAGSLCSTWRALEAGTLARTFKGPEGVGGGVHAGSSDLNLCQI
eukprot:1176774-Prorocentrum_minimum.AAC.2